jgi:hypothetical protein
MGQSLTAQLASGPSNGTLQLNSDGSFTYTPNADFVGSDRFQYRANDGLVSGDPATVTLTVDQVVPQAQPGSMPSAVATADFTNDGSPDVAMLDQGLNTVSIYTVSGGAIASAPLSTIQVGSSPGALATGRFAADGNVDMAVANSGDNTVSILLGNGDGTFRAAPTLTGFNDPVALTVGDFYGDGETDLAVVNQGSNTVSLLKGNGDGTFSLVGTLTTDASPTSIAAADFNSDGAMDLVVSNSASNTVSVLLGNGDGTFAPATVYAVGTTPVSVTTGDFDNDGTVDVAVANCGSNDVSVLLGNGDGTFQAVTSYAVGSNPVAVVAGQFGGAGERTALAVVNAGSSNLSILSGIGTSGVETQDTLTTVANPRGIALGDFGNNGQQQGVVVGRVAAGGGQLALAAALPNATGKEKEYGYWYARAYKWIRMDTQAESTSDTWVQFNKRITAAYAELFLSNPNLFPWAGLAAFASDQVGTAINTLRSEWLASKPSWNLYLRTVGYLEYKGASYLAHGNLAVYLDIYPAFQCYAWGGIKAVRDVHRLIGPGFPDVIVNALQTVADGESQKDADKIWDGNLALFQHEQRDIL